MKLFAKWFRRTSAEEQALLVRCRGDAAQLERLIAYELARRPQLSRAAAARSAVERWRRD